MKKIKRLSLTIDYAFKKFFVTRPDLLIDFLNAVLQKYNAFTIESVKILNPELPGESIDDKKAILDILATDSNGRMLNIEMQANCVRGFVKRSALYAFRLYVSQNKKGMKHEDIPPVLSINLLDFSLFPDARFHRVFRILDIDDPSLTLLKDLEFHFVELTKLQAGFAELTDPLEIWSVFIRNSETLTEDEMAVLESKKPEMAEAHKTLDEISQDSLARLQYDRRKYAIYFYEKELEDRFSDGMLHAKLATARNMLAEKAELSFVLRVTGLNEEQLREHGII